MKQLKTTIRLSYDDLDLLTAYQTAKDIPTRTQAIMEAVNEACAREKITAAILPETMRASYYMLARPQQPSMTTEEGKSQKNDTDDDEPQGKSELEEAIARGEDPSTGWHCLHQRSKVLKWCTIEHHEQCITCFVEERIFACCSLFQGCRDIFSDVKGEIEKKYEKERAQHEKEVQDKEQKPDVTEGKETTAPTVTPIEATVKIPESNAEDTPKVQAETSKVPETSVLDKRTPTTKADDDESQEVRYIKVMHANLQVVKGQQTLGDAKKPKENSE